MRKTLTLTLSRNTGRGNLVRRKCLTHCAAAGTMVAPMTGGIELSSPTTLPLEACPDCDYALAGLPAEGVCPECGRAYDQDTVVLYGRGGGVHENAINSPTGLLVLQIICIGIVPVSIWFAGYSSRSLIITTLAVLGYFTAVAARRR